MELIITGILIGILLLYILIKLVISGIKYIKEEDHLTAERYRLGLKESELIKTYDKKNKELIKKENDLIKYKEDISKDVIEKEKILDDKLQSFEVERKTFIAEFEEQKKQIKNDFCLLFSDKLKALPYFAKIIAEYKTVPINYIASKLPYYTEKKWQEKYKEKLVSLKNDLKLYKAENLILKSELEYFKYLFPEIEEDIEFQDNSTNVNDDWITKEEYNSLTELERNKLAFDRYKNRKKTKWEIGRDFEMYIGYLCSLHNCKVDYFGITQKLKDKGRDLIVEDKNAIYIIQCKYWSINKLIHEKHLCQLFGTSIMYELESVTKKKIIPVFVCHNTLSSTALEFAKKLNIKVYENVELKEFPMIKCNKETMIYHLPCDQQYEHTVNNIEFVLTVEEAESKGYRRAWKWHSS